VLGREGPCVFLVFNHPRCKEHNPGVMFFVFGVVEGEGKGKGHPRCEEHDPGVVFFMSGVVEGEGKGEGHPRCKEHDPGVVFFVSGVVEGGKGSGEGRGRCWKGWGAAEGGWELALVGPSCVLDVFGSCELLGVELKSVK